MGKPFLITVLLVFVSSFLIAQETKYIGRVVDSKTQLPIKNATVLISGTDILTTTNQVGFFELVGDSMEIILSHVSYEPVTAFLNPSRPRFLIKLAESKYSLQELVIGNSLFLQDFSYNQNKFETGYKFREQDSSLTEHVAEFPGGHNEFHNYLTSSLLEKTDSLTKPFEAKVQFTIAKNGQVKVDSIRSSSKGIPNLGTIFDSSPNWIPSFQHRIPVGSIFEQSINFSRPTEFFAKVEQQPEFPGGLKGFYQFVGNRMNYPVEAREQGIEGRVYVQFVVNGLGEVEDVKVLRGIGNGCNEEAIRSIKLTSGKWIPGTQKGRPVRVKISLPIVFKLAGGSGSSSRNTISTPKSSIKVISPTKTVEFILKNPTETSLSLSYNYLSKLDPRIGEATQLKYLNLTKNNFKKLPKEIGLLVNLIELDLTGNLLKELPYSVINLVSLEKLSLKMNRFKVFPDELLKLQNLKTLDLSFCGIKEIPLEIASMRNLKKLIITQSSISRKNIKEILLINSDIEIIK